MNPDQHPRYWLSRLIVCTWAGALGIATLLNPDSIAGRALLGHGFGELFLRVLVVCSAIGMLDTVTNDLGRRGMHMLRDWRHVGFCAIAMILVLLAAVICLQLRRFSLAAFWFLPAFFAFLITWLDLFARHDARRKGIA